MVGPALSRRIKRFFSQVGEEFLINGTTAARGVFQMMTTGQLHMLYIDTEAASVSRPAHYLFCAADTNIASTDVIERDSRSFLVRKVFTFRVGDTALYKIASLD